MADGGSVLKHAIMALSASASVLLVICAGCPQISRSAAGLTEIGRPPRYASDSTQSTAGGGSTQELEDVEERRGPFSLAGQDLTVVLHFKRLSGSGSLDSLALVSLDIIDAAGRVQYEESFSYGIEEGTFSETCSADVRLLRGSNGSGLLIESWCLPSAPLAGGPWQIVGVVRGKLVSFGKPLVTDGEWGEFVPGAITRTAGRTQVLSDTFSLRVWTGYFFVSIPVRIDWQEGKLTPGQRCMYQTGSGFAEEGCEMPVDGVQMAPRQEMTFVRMFRESNERSGPPAHVVVRTDSKVEVTSGKVAIIWSEWPDAISISAGEDVWVKVRIDGQEGWIHTPEDLNAIGLFLSG